MTALASLLKYVRSGTTEGDLPHLVDTFVTPDQLAELSGIEPGSLRILVGSKGAGKSALLEWLRKQATRVKLPCVLLRPDQLVDTGAPPALDLSSLKAYYYDRLLRSLASEVGRQVKAYIPLTGNAEKLYNEARSSGQYQGDFVTKALELLSAVALPAKGVDGVKLAKELAGTNSHAALVRAINGQLLTDTSKVFLLLIDDTDQLARPDEPEQLNKIWALILAARRLAMECPSVRPILSLRSSVWARLTNENAGQRDQVDHVRPLVVSLAASDSLISQIVEKRLWRAARDAEVKGSDAYEPFFESFKMILPTSDERRTWPSFIVKSSRERPRDALQLIKNMVDAAGVARHIKIGDEDASKAMHVYSGERVDDVVNEYSLDCPAIREVIGSFHSVDFELNFEAVRDHLGRVSGVTAIHLRGHLLKTERDEDMVRLLGLLHEVGFINPRVPDASQPRKFKHINFSEDPIFVRYTNWNGMQGAAWEVHPAFRDHLLSIRRAKELRRV